MREYFDLNPQLIYLNSGTHSICPREVLQAVTRYQRNYEFNPTAELIQVWGRLWEIQKELAHFFKADAHDLFLRPNITAVMNAVLLGAPLPAHSEILTTDVEYGAITNILKMRAQKEGHTLRTLSLPSDATSLAQMSEEDWAQKIISALRPETKLLLLSHVITGNGLVLPIEQIALETKRRGILLAVDGAHAPGAISLDFSKLENVDFYGGNLHKWMMGPKGTSFGWVSKRHHDTLIPQQAGWTTFEIPENFSAFGEQDPFQGRMLTSSCIDFAPFLALHETLEFWRRLGPERIRAQLQHLRNQLIRQIQEELGWALLSPSVKSLQGPLLAFELPKNLQTLEYEVMKTLLHQYGLQIGLPRIHDRYCLRLSPHIYNSEEEITRSVKILGDFAKSRL